MINPPALDKTRWGDGPWQTEPDRVEWRHAGLPCLAVRNHHGAWCGYAAVPPAHPFHGKAFNEVDVDVHGGLTYGHLCAGHICHVPAPGEPDDVYWLGFDCGHAFDLSPGLEAAMSEIPGMAAIREQYPPQQGFEDVYRTLDYVQAETNKLAEQLAAAAVGAQPTENKKEGA